MKLHFGTALDNRAYPHSTSQNQGSLIAGPTKLLTYLEEICLSPYHETSEAYAHIRLEFTRKLLQDILTDQDDAFFKDSFVADPYGSSKKILELRDELLLAGHDFCMATNLNRLHVLHLLEKAIKKLGSDWPKGFADRFDFVRKKINTVQKNHLPFNEMFLHFLCYFTHVTTLGEVKEQVLKYIPVMARPMVMYRDKHPIIWTGVYADIEVEILNLTDRLGGKEPWCPTHFS